MANNYDDQKKQEVGKFKASENLLTNYLRDIGKISLINKDKEIELARRIQKGDDGALNELVEANLRFVVTIAKKYQGCGISLLDLINEGNLGLIEAAKRYDPDRGVKFISYAVWWIRQAIMQALAEQGGVTRLPLKQAGVLYKIGEKFKRLAQKLEREPTSEELAEALNISVKDVDILLQVSRNSVSLDASMNDEDKRRLMQKIEDTSVPGADEILMNATFRGEIQDLMDVLNEREREIVTLHFGLNGKDAVTLEEIGKRIGLTRERIRQIEVKAKEKMKKEALKRHLKDYLN